MFYNTQVLSDARAPCIVAAYGQGGGEGRTAAAAVEWEEEQEGNSTARSTTTASNTRSKYRSIRKGAFSDAAAPVWVSTGEAPLSRLEI